MKKMTIALLALIAVLAITLVILPNVISWNLFKPEINANEYPEGFAYEVQIECNSRWVFPYVSVWPGNFGVVIPGTGINSGLFLRRLL